MLGSLGLYPGLEAQIETEDDSISWKLLEGIGLDRALLPEARPVVCLLPQFDLLSCRIFISLKEGERVVLTLNVPINYEYEGFIVELGSYGQFEGLKGVYEVDAVAGQINAKLGWIDEMFRFDVPAIGGYEANKVCLPHLLTFEGRTASIFRADPEAIVQHIRENSGGEIHHFLSYRWGHGREYRYDSETRSIKGKWSSSGEPLSNPVFGPELYTRDTFEL